jgi:hypothetical protein
MAKAKSTLMILKSAYESRTRVHHIVSHGEARSALHVDCHKLTVMTCPTSVPSATTIDPNQKHSEYARKMMKNAIVCSNAFPLAVIIPSLRNGPNDSLSSLANSLSPIPNDWTIRDAETTCSIMDEVVDSRLSWATVFERYHQPRRPVMMIINGMRAKRVPASLGDWTKLETSAW